MVLKHTTSARALTREGNAAPAQRQAAPQTSQPVTAASRAFAGAAIGRVGRGGRYTPEPNISA